MLGLIRIIFLIRCKNSQKESSSQERKATENIVNDEWDYNASMKKDNYHYLKIITRNDHISILHPIHSGHRLARDCTFKLNIHAFIGIEVGRVN